MLTQDLPSDISNSHIYHVTPTVSEIKLDKDLFAKAFWSQEKLADQITSPQKI